MKRILSLLVVSAMIVMLSSCKKNEDEPRPIPSVKIMIGISALDINQTTLPNSKTRGVDDVFAIQIHSTEVDSEQLSPYAYGLFTDWSDLSFEGVSGATYKIEATLVRDASGKIMKTGEIYAKPFNAPVTNTFTYDTEALTDISSSDATMLDGVSYAVPTLDRYFGLVTKKITTQDANINLFMKRVSFGIQNNVESAKGTLVVKIEGAPDVELESADVSNPILYSFSDILAAHNADETTAAYSESFNVNIFNGSVKVFSKNMNFVRNELSIIETNEAGEYQFGIDIEVPFEDLVRVVADNLYYNETQLNVEKRYWIVLRNRKQETTSQKAINWYVNGELKGNGAEFKFTPTVLGGNSIKYVVKKAYSATGNEVSEEIVSKTYSSSGVYILNEPNMSASEQTRSINKHTFGSTTVDRFITGDYSSFGVTNQYISNWSGEIYNVAPYPYDGIAFSKFTSVDGTFVKAIKSISGQTRAFAGLSPEVGILTTSSGAYIVNLSDLTLSDATLSGSANSRNVFVTDGYVFIITSGSAKAYKVDGLSTTTSPVTLGRANSGFVQSKDGYIWAANGGTLLRIDPRDLSTQTMTLPDDAQIKFSSSPWKQCSWVASTAENVFFFTKDGGRGTAKEVYKYDIATETLTSKFITAPTTGYGFYSTSLLYDAERDEVVGQGQKSGYGANSAYNAIWRFNAHTGDKTHEVLYNTEPLGHDDYLNQWYPAMMAPIKVY